MFHESEEAALACSAGLLLPAAAASIASAAAAARAASCRLSGASFVGFFETTRTLSL
jgi:hypothetical protein